MDLNEILQVFNSLPEDKQKEIEDLALADTESRVWVPNPGPQTEAFYSEADELFYGGQAGGGKTDLMLGLALTEHRSSLILRRTNKEVTGLVERMTNIVGNRDGYSGQTGIWRHDKRVIELGGCQLEDDKQKYKGIARDFYGFDEISDFTESIYQFVTGWNRTTIPGQRCRIVGAGNPPTRPEGLWVMKRWGAWLDPQHRNPAEPGELRWYTTNEMGEEVEVDGPGPHYLGGPKAVYARSRTFIPATLDDNPDLKNSGYQSTLDALPIELRRAYRDGNFGAGLKDDPYQVIPTEWVVEAQQRWGKQPPLGIPMCAIGVDVAIAKDNFVIAPRYDGWYDELTVIPGGDIPDAKQAAGKVVSLRRGNAVVIVDVGGGWGADCHAQLMSNGIDSFGYMGVKVSKRKSTDGQFHFNNTRTEAYWRFREALDPTQPGGSIVRLPPDQTLKADLCAPSYEVRQHTDGMLLKIESKDDVVKRLGRSTDRGDAVVMAWYKGDKQHNINGGWQGGRGVPVVNRGKRHRR